MLTTLPNLLTLSRILVIPPVIVLFYQPEAWARWTVLAIFLAAAFTDWLDGWLARRSAQVSNLGRFLDPIADKLLVCAVLFMLAATGRLTGPGAIPAVIILLRELLISGLREFLAGDQVVMPVSRLAKWKTTVQLAAIALLIVAGDLSLTALAEAGLWLAAALTLITGWDYMRIGIRHMTRG
jgi:cardiolipin synthase